MLFPCRRKHTCTLPEGHISDIEAAFEGFIVPVASPVKSETAALLPGHGGNPSLPDTASWQALA